MIDINLPILIAQILTFLVALYIVWKIAWGPLVSMMRRREDIVRENIEKSKEERQQAEVLKKDYEIQLGAIREESQSIFSQAVKDAQKERDEINLVALFLGVFDGLGEYALRLFPDSSELDLVILFEHLGLLALLFGFFNIFPYDILSAAHHGDKRPPGYFPHDIESHKKSQYLGYKYWQVYVNHSDSPLLNYCRYFINGLANKSIMLMKSAKSARDSMNASPRSMVI